MRSLQQTFRYVDRGGFATKMTSRRAGAEIFIGQLFRFAQFSIVSARIFIGNSSGSANILPCTFLIRRTR
jgi:hypothetical protein